MKRKNRLNANLDNLLFYLQEHSPFIFERNTYVMCIHGNDGKILPYSLSYT